MRALILVLLALVGISPGWAQQGARSGKTNAVKPCTSPAPEALDLKKIIFMLTRDYMADCVVPYVKQSGVDFYATQDNMAWLKYFNAPKDLSDLIKPPPPPVSPPHGDLTVQCEVAEGHECEIVANDRYYGRTEAGQKKISDIPLGDTKVSVWSEGLEPASQTITLTANSPKNAHFSLRPSLLARRQNARDLLSKVVQTRFGGIQGLTEIDRLANPQVGTSTLSDGASGQQEWNLQVSQTPTGATAVTFTSKASPKDFCTITVSANEAASVPCVGKLKGEPSPQLKRAALLFAQFQIHAQLSRVLTRRVIDVPDSGPNQIGTDDGPDSYVLTLSDAGVPSEIVYRSAPDATPIKAAYAAYSKVERYELPHKLTIWEGTGEKPLVEFSLSSIGKPPSTQPTKGKKSKKT